MRKGLVLKLMDGSPIIETVEHKILPSWKVVDALLALEYHRPVRRLYVQCAALAESVAVFVLIRIALIAAIGLLSVFCVPEVLVGMAVVEEVVAVVVPVLPGVVVSSSEPAPIRASILSHKWRPCQASCRRSAGVFR